MLHLGCWPSTINFDWDFFFLFFPNNFSNIESTANSSLISASVFTSGKYRSWVYSCSKILQVGSHLWGVYTQSFGGAWWEGVLVGQAQVPGLGVDLRGGGPTMPVSLLPTQDIPNAS